MIDRVAAAIGKQMVLTDNDLQEMAKAAIFAMSLTLIAAPTLPYTGNLPDGDRTPAGPDAIPSPGVAY